MNCARCRTPKGLLSPHMSARCTPIKCRRGLQLKGERKLRFWAFCPMQEEAVLSQTPNPAAAPTIVRP